MSNSSPFAQDRYQLVLIAPKDEENATPYARAIKVVQGDVETMMLRLPDKDARLVGEQALNGAAYLVCK